jgi:glucose/mannose-6-phosphate isomerase
MKKNDIKKMKEYVEGFTAQLKESIEIGKSFVRTSSGADIHNVVISGMGGSGIGGTIVNAIVEQEINVPIIVNKTYTLPKFTNENTLVILSSFSGNTEETLSVMNQVLTSGAQIVCVTSGGKMLDIAKKNQLNYIQIPDKIKSPRACLGYSFVQLLYILKEYELISDDFEGNLIEAMELLDFEKESIQELATVIANKLTGKLPILYSDTRMGAIITRAQQQMNENGKHICHTNVFPEMNHNELVGWACPENILSNSEVILIYSDYDEKRVKHRFKICKDIFEEHASGVTELMPKGRSFIEQSLYYINLFDYVSVYLAYNNEVDPFPVKSIDYLKDELAKV